MPSPFTLRRPSLQTVRDRLLFPHLFPQRVFFCNCLLLPKGFRNEKLQFGRLFLLLRSNYRKKCIVIFSCKHSTLSLLGEFFYFSQRVCRIIGSLQYGTTTAMALIHSLLIGQILAKFSGEFQKTLLKFEFRKRKGKVVVLWPRPSQNVNFKAPSRRSRAVLKRG